MTPLKAPESAYYYQDEDGQWWYDPPASPHRTRARSRNCDFCHEAYVTNQYQFAKSRFCSRSCSGKNAGPGRGPKSTRWKGGRRKTRGGYVEIWMPDHHSIAHNGRKYVREHRLVMEKVLGRPLTRDEQVHHINGIPDDNRPENLELWHGSHPAGVRAGDVPHCATCTCASHDKG